MDDRVARLTEGQREALRMVYRHMETKEIARALGISPDGVTQRIKAAMRFLGVNKRRDAAQILAEAEGHAAYPRQVYPPRDIAIAPDPATFALSTEGRRKAVSRRGDAGGTGRLRGFSHALAGPVSASPPDQGRKPE